MRVMQAGAEAPDAVISRARSLGCTAVAWTLEALSPDAARLTSAAGLEVHGFLQLARDPLAAANHPEWMHCPQHHEWLRKFPDFTGSHPAVVWPYIGLNTVAAFDYALNRAVELIGRAPDLRRIWLADLQGAPMGCGCGNPCCRSWDNAPGPKLASTPYNRPELLFPYEIYESICAALPGRDIVPVLCPECERSIDLDGVPDPDGPEGTDLCQGIPCGDVCTLQYFPRLMTRFRANVHEIGLLLMVDSLEKRSPIFGEPRGWATRAHRHYGADLIPCIEPDDASAFDRALILSDAPQDCRPEAPPVGYRAEVPPILCGYCPPGV